MKRGEYKLTITLSKAEYELISVTAEHQKRSAKAFVRSAALAKANSFATSNSQRHRVIDFDYPVFGQTRKG